MHGGRFNRKGCAALYNSLSAETAWAEAQQAFPFKAQPMTLCGYVVDCDTVVDLTSYETLIRLEIDPKDLACPWEDLASRDITPPSWKIADKLIDAGVAAIIVPSFASAAGRDAKNVVFWKWADTLPHMVRVIDDESRLPHDRSSWT